MNIFALSSGRGPCGIAIIRMSGPDTLSICKLISKEKKIKENKIIFEEIINKLKSEGFQFKILTIGKKGREQLKREFGENMIDHVDLSEVKKIAYENASTISDNIISMFLNNEFDVATIFYNQFESVISQVPQASQLIPIEINSEK